MLVLARKLGIIGLAIANTMGVLVQAVLLLPLALHPRRYRLVLDWTHPGVRQVLHLLLPLMLANVVAKATPVIDRFFASQLPEGNISHLGYAFRIFSVLCVLTSTGISTVLFPRMATDASNTDLASLRQTMSVGLRVMWLAIAPAMMIGITLAFPFVTVLFRRGQFTVADAVAVASLIQIYLLALPPACLGTVTTRGFYVLKDTRTVAILASIESIVYVFYTALLSRAFGVSGIAFGYVLLFNISLLWQVLIVSHKTGKVGGGTVLNSFLRTGVAALIGGIVAWGGTLLTSNVLLQLVYGAVFGLAAYSAGLWLLQSREVYQVWHALRT
jgi:putative peptidoglycan lipid II flippase